MATQLVKSKSLDKLQVALSAQFPPRKVEEILLHYEILTREARLSHYESCLVNAGKFVEAVLKSLHHRRTGEDVDSVSVHNEIKQLELASSLSETERMTIPRTLQAIYECRSKRGGAHNFSFDPTKMDCALVVAASNWVMEELTRRYLTDDPIAAQALIENLLVKNIPLVEQVDGDYLVLKPGLSARIQLEVILYQHYPDRCSTKDLTRWVHNHSDDNVRVTLRGMKAKNLAHENNASWKLTDSGVCEAEAEIAQILNGSTEVNKKLRVRTKGIKHGRK